MFRLFIFWAAFMGILPATFAQTCCSGGVPLSSNLGLPAAEAKKLQLALTYDLNILNTLKEGTKVLDDQIRNRKTHAALLQLGYSFTDRFAADVLFSFVRQERTIQNDQSRNTVQSKGWGDAVLLLKYRVWESKQLDGQWTIGLGTKFATGAADRTDQRGILLNADLQPGSGAGDWIFWSQFTHIGWLRPSMVFFVTASHNRRGVNEDYLPIINPNTGISEGQRYQFGNEWQLMTGLSDRLLIGKTLVDPGLSIRFRSVSFDRINDQRLPSTGGSWWFVNPTITCWAGTSLSINVNVELPLYANIIGTQLSPTIRWNTGFFYRINFQKERLDPPAEIRIF